MKIIRRFVDWNNSTYIFLRVWPRHPSISNRSISHLIYHQSRSSAFLSILWLNADVWPISSRIYRVLGLMHSIWPYSTQIFSSMKKNPTKQFCVKSAHIFSVLSRWSYHQRWIYHSLPFFFFISSFSFIAFIFFFYICDSAAAAASVYISLYVSVIFTTGWLLSDLLFI